MSRPPITLPREATLDDALLLFDRHSIGALAVVDHDGRLVGIITVRDVLGAYRRLFGIGAAGSSLVEVRDDGRPDLMSRIAAALEGGGIACTRLVRAGRRTAGGGPDGLRPRADLQHPRGPRGAAGRRARDGAAQAGAPSP